MWIFRIATAILAIFLLAPVTARAASLFDDGIPMPGFQMVPSWKNVIADMHAATTLASASDTPVGPLPASLSYAGMHPEGLSPVSTSCVDERHCVPKAWTDFLTGLRGLDARAQLQAVNRWTNAKPYVDDMANWGVPDYWETPGEFIAHGGDCEDFAIAKYFSLVRLGFPSRDLRIVIVSDSQAHDFHAVLVARLEGALWLLDNQQPDVVPLEAMAQYAPIYSLNENGGWMHAQPVIHLEGGMTITTAAPAVTPPVRLAAVP
jgi:predicted transglutaminase-like cysteine proteinase